MTRKFIGIWNFGGIPRIGRRVNLKTWLIFRIDRVPYATWDLWSIRSRDDLFTVKVILTCSRLKSYWSSLLVREESALYLNIWVPKAPKKECFIEWLTMREMILTAENLRKRRFTYIILCLSAELGEDIDHLLLHCPMAARLCSVILIGLEYNWWCLKGESYCWGLQKEEDKTEGMASDMPSSIQLHF